MNEHSDYESNELRCDNSFCNEKLKSVVCTARLCTNTAGEVCGPIRIKRDARTERLFAVQVSRLARNIQPSCPEGTCNASIVVSELLNRFATGRIGLLGVYIGAHGIAQLFQSDVQRLHRSVRATNVFCYLPQY